MKMGACRLLRQERRQVENSPVLTWGQAGAQCVGPPWCWCIPVHNKDKSLTRVFLGHKFQRREEKGFPRKGFSKAYLCTSLGMPLLGRVNEKKNQELLSRWFPTPPTHTLQTGFFQSTPDKWMAGLSLKPSREGLPKSVLQSLVTLYTGKSFLASSWNSYPCVPPTPQKTWTSKVVLKGKGSLKCGEKHPCLILW